MNVKLFRLFIKIMESWTAGSKDIVRFKTNHVVEETAKLVHFTFYLDVWS
jgi:hypothetical protein